MEWWILAGLAVAGAAAVAVLRLRAGRRADPEREGKNIYPLW